MATKMSSPRELFLHELSDILTTEKTIVKMLPRLQREAKDEQLAEGFKKHLEQTRQHVANVEQVFKKLGVRPKAERCHGIEGIQAEHDEGVREVAPDMVDLFAASAAARTEHYEIAAYEGLVTMAKAMGEPDAARLLEENLKQDKTMLRETNGASRRLTRKAAKQQKRR